MSPFILFFYYSKLFALARSHPQQFSVKIQRDSSVARASFDYAQGKLFRMTLRKFPVVILSEAKNFNRLRTHRELLSHPF